MQNMTGKQRFYRYFEGKRVDRVPNLNIAIHFAAKHAGIPFGLFCTDHRKIVEANLKTSRDFNFDVLNLMCDPYREVADFGAGLHTRKIKCHNIWGRFYRGGRRYPG